MNAKSDRTTRLRALVATATLGATTLGATALSADPYGNWAGGYGHGMWGGGLGMVGGALMMLLFWGGIIALIFFAVRAFSGRAESGGGDAGKTDALAILRDRFARGEIDVDEFEARKRALEG